MIYLNNAATSYPKPIEVLDSVCSCLKSFPGYSSRGGDCLRTDYILTCRKILGQFFHISNPNHIFFTSGSTESLNLAIKGFGLNQVHVVTTAIEHNSVLRPLKELENLKKIDLTIVDCDSSGYIAPSQILSAICPQTKLAVINHCSNVTGTYLDIAEITKLLHSQGINVIVDASQSAGECEISIEDTGIDVLAFTGHKSLYGIQGIGGIYIREGLDIFPLKTGGTGSKSELLYQPKERPLYYEAGTPNMPGIVSLKAGVSFISSVGAEKIATKKRAIVRQFWQSLSELPNLIIYGKYQDSWNPSIFSFNISKISPSEVAYILEESFGIVVRAGLHCAPLVHQAIGSYPEGCVRISPSIFTTQEEIDTTIQAIRTICQVKYAK